MFDNPENLSEIEINNILAFGFSFTGPNRRKRKLVLESYSYSVITKEEWIKKYCI